MVETATPEEQPCDCEYDNVQSVEITDDRLRYGLLSAAHYADTRTVDLGYCEAGHKVEVELMIDPGTIIETIGNKAECLCDLSVRFLLQRLVAATTLH